MRIPSASTDRIVYFVAVDITDLKTRKTGLSSFTVYRSRNGGTATIYTTPTVVELSAGNMPGVYGLTIDEDTTIGATHDTEEYCLHITQASMAPVTRALELYRPEGTEGNTLDVTATGGAGIDWGNVENKTTANALTNTSIITTQKVDVETIKTNPVVNAGTVTFPTTATLASTTNITAGTVTTTTNVTTVNGLANNVITAASIQADAITDAKVAADVTIASVTGAVGSVTGAVGSVTGAVGSVTGNVGGNVTGSVGSVTAGVTVTTNNDKTGYALSSAGIQAIWDALTSALTTVGSVGKLLVDNINATIGSRLSSAGYTAPDNTTITNIYGVVDTEVGAIKAKTDQMVFTVSNQLDTNALSVSPTQVRTAVGLASANLDTQLTAIDDFLDTEIAAIKAVTDMIPNAGALTTIQADLDNIQTRLPATLVSGRIDASVGAMAAGVVTAASIATNAIDADALAADAVTEIGTGVITAGVLTENAFMATAYP